MKQFNNLIYFVLFSLLVACSRNMKEQNALDLDRIDPGVDHVLPILMINEANAILYDEASIHGKIIAKIAEENNQSLIGLTAVADAENRIWYKCYYPTAQIEGWTTQVSHQDVSNGEIDLPFLQNLSRAYLQLGATPSDAKYRLGKPQSESTKTGPLEVSGYIDEDNIVSTTTLNFDGIRLIYEDDRMIHAFINKAGKKFGWIVCGDKECTKDFLIKKFELNQNNSSEYDNTISMGGFLSIQVSFDDNKLVKTIEFNARP